MTDTQTTTVIADGVHGPTVDEDAQGKLIREAVHDIARGGLRSVCFVGCGGSYFGAAPTHYLLDQRVAAHPTLRMNADEFNWRRPPIVGDRSLVVVASHSGSTPETVRAVETARALGAPKVLAVSGDKSSELARAADVSFVYHHDKASTSKARVYGHLGHAILEASGLESEEEAAEATAAYDALTGVLRDAVLAVDPATRKVAQLVTSASLSFILGAGPDEDVARSLSMCYLQEMQWLHSEAFNAGEFFHGAFEVVTEEDPAIVVMLGEHAARPMEERAVRFVERHSKRCAVIDSRTVALEGIPENFRAELSPHIVNAIADRVAEMCEEITGHSLKIRRYMGEVEY
ncbi:MAG: SIS domain-containing protein [Acidimicrobiales bacterium]